jgi:tetratricopeptide (TPR) repeat protein
MARAVWLAPVLACALVLSGCGPAKPKTAPSLDYAGLLRLYDRAIAASRRELQAAPDDVALREGVALALLQRAVLSGHFPDYAAADQALNQAFAASDEPHAPLLTRLHLELLLHRFPQAEVDRERLEHRYRIKDTAGFASESAELDFQRGRYAEALAGFHRSLAIEEGPQALARLALLQARTGEYFEGAALLDRAEKQEHSDTPYLHAWLELQQGQLLLDRGRWEQADEYFRHADMLLPGWWLPRSRRAELLALQGQRDEAQAQYETLAEETGDPEFIDAVARLRREGPDPASAAPWIARAAEAHRQRLELLPEAACAHAAEHELWFGQQPQQALDLARRNAELRPNGESRILLAQALYKAGQAAAAHREIEAVLAGAWNTAELHAIAAQIDAALGLREDADRQHALALELNPRAFRMYHLPQPAQPETLP